MKISGDKTTILENKKLDYIPVSVVNSDNFSVKKTDKVISNINPDSIKNKEELKDLAKEVNVLSEDKNIYVSLYLDESTGKNIMQFVDRKTKEVIKQIPSEEMLKIAQEIDKFLKNNSKSFPPGFFINERI